MKRITSLMLIVFVGGVCCFGQQKSNSSASSLRYYEEMISNLTNQVRLLQDENARLVSQVSDLSRQCERVSAENRANQAEMARIRNSIKADAEQRERQLKDLKVQLEKIAKMGSVAAPPAPVATPTSSKRQQDAIPQAKQEKFEEYIVQEGANLSIIAKAYGVTVDEIKRANNLKSDRLRIGQKLLVPVK